MGELELVCLGTGAGATAIISGDPSSSIVVLKKGEPLLWVDVGFGVTKQYHKYIGQKIPSCIYITHNHLDHSGEIPVTLYLMMKQAHKEGLDRSPVRLMAAPEVMKRVQEHRMHEMMSLESNLDLYGNWTPCALGSRVPLEEDGRYTIEVVKSQHSEDCYGILLYDNEKLILGCTGDSGLNSDLYRRIFEAPVIIADARSKGTYEHAGFDEVQKYAEQKDQQVYVIGYGSPNEAPEETDYPNLKPLQLGQKLTLDGRQDISRDTKVKDTSVPYPSSQEAMRDLTSQAYPPTSQAVKQRSS